MVALQLQPRITAVKDDLDSDMAAQLVRMGDKPFVFQGQRLRTQPSWDRLSPDSSIGCITTTVACGCIVLLNIIWCAHVVARLSEWLIFPISNLVFWLSLAIVDLTSIDIVPGGAPGGSTKTGGRSRRLLIFRISSWSTPLSVPSLALQAHPDPCTVCSNPHPHTLNSRT